MKYFLDTEFLEGPQRRTFLGVPIGNTKPTIDLISLGIVSEDNREYYAISKDFNLKEAWNRYEETSAGQGDANNWLPSKKIYWIRENVLIPMCKELSEKEGVFAYGEDAYFTYKTCKRLINKYGKTNKQIANEIVEFVYGESDNLEGLSPLQESQKYEHNDKSRNPQFYAYYADYDWVVFCWLFGNMIDLPKGFPMYCRDLKQMLDEKAIHQENKYKDMSRLEAWVQDVKNHPNYPKQINEHNALGDAKWNKRLYTFLNIL